jgi:hypothetical protein
MESINPQINNYPGNHIQIKTDHAGLEFNAAKDIANQKAKELCADPMLLSWYQGNTGESYPNLECGPGDKPAWMTYAESRGGDIVINIDQGLYIFIFLSI